MVKEGFKEFLEKYMDDDGHRIYWKKLKSMIEYDKQSLLIDFMDLEIWNPTISEKLLSDPHLTLPKLLSVFKALVETEDPGYVDRYDDLLHIRFFNLPERNKKTISIIRSRQQNKLISVDGIITQISEIEPSPRMAIFKCSYCFMEIPVIQDEGVYRAPKRCLNDVCGKTTGFTLLKNRTKYIDLQVIAIQERIEDMGSSRTASILLVYCFDDLAGRATAGDKITVTGILRSSLKNNKQSDKPARWSKFLVANSVIIDKDEILNPDVSEEDEKVIKEFAKNEDSFIKYWSSIAPAIHGNDVVKKAIGLMLLGGTIKIMEDGTKFRGESNILLIGDPGVGKSKILKYVQNLHPRALYASAKSSSAAGLTAAVLKDEDDRLTLQIGLLPKADRGIALIDEFDKMDKNDRAAIHESLESHQLTIMKGGFEQTLNTRCSTLAAANPKLSRWDPDKDVLWNLNLPDTIISRMDLIFPLVDRPDEKKDRERARYILSQHKEGTLAQQPDCSSDFIRKYVAYVRENCHPHLTDEANEAILEFYLRLRKQSMETRPDGKPKSIGITPRYLESIVRLSEARAKVNLRDKVTAADARTAIEIMEESFKMIATDPETGEIDVDRITGKGSATRNKTRTINEIITELTKNGDSASMKDIVKKAVEHGIKKDDSEQVVHDLIQNGVFFEPRPGMIKKIS